MHQAGEPAYAAPARGFGVHWSAARPSPILFAVSTIPTRDSHEAHASPDHTAISRHRCRRSSARSFTNARPERSPDDALPRRRRLLGASTGHGGRSAHARARRQRRRRRGGHGLRHRRRGAHDEQHRRAQPDPRPASRRNHPGHRRHHAGSRHLRPRHGAPGLLRLCRHRHPGGGGGASAPAQGVWEAAAGHGHGARHRLRGERIPCLPRRVGPRGRKRRAQRGISRNARPST